MATQLNNNRSKKSLAPAAFQRQVQTAIAVSCMTWVHSLDQMKLQQVYQKLHESYHGNPVAGTIPMVNDCMKGQGSFGSLWDHSDSTENGSCSLTMKRCMTQKDDVLYSAGSAFTLVSLSSANQSNPIVIDGRAIFTLAQSALRNGKKALSVEQSAYVDGKLPSGWNDDDLDEHILNGMWSMIGQSKASVDVDGDDEAEEEAETSQRPEGWIFPGWMAYRLLGPRAHVDFQSSLFQVGDWMKNKRNGSGGDDKSSGRAEHRKALAETSNKIRMNTGDRGVPLGACKKDMVIIAQAENRADQRSHECGMLALSQVIESKQKRVASLTKLLEIPGMEAGQKTQILEKIMELMADIQDKENIMEQKSENKRKPSDLIDGFLKQGIAETAKASGKTPRISNPIVDENADAENIPVTPRNLASS
jgi:hypothetical protein